ncbi:lipopolysaccharide biosynthesis protein [Winogradskyella litoriviva]|uniref:Lipopolysaccharide biosynthesis protein n=1 Tax=Winogradskyella litoriviva TaxID=1220182 RepID=A0ABX2E551_9FLAO|nr:lipopolysaccharide biosynthesis protein [Winogradskyella litoriviva]NRD23523.1 lipopolysaccharide biosynthesis protein [Winogradskyella litoriviva]
MNNNISKTKSGITGLIWMFFGNIFNTVIQLLIIAVLSRLLTPAEFGVMSIILIFVNFSDIFTQMGIGSAIVQLEKLTKKHISLSFAISFILGSIIGTLFYFIAPLIAIFFNLENLDEPIQFFSFFFPLKSFTGVAFSILQRELKFSIIVKCRSISYFLGYGLVSIILAYMGMGLWALIYGQLAMLLINFILVMFLVKPSFTLIANKKTYKDILVFGSGFTLDSSFNFIAENSDNIIVGKFLGEASLGVYSKAFQFLSIPASFFGQLYDKVLFPVLSSIQNDVKKLTSFYFFSISFCLIILLPVSVFLMFNAELLVNVLLGNQWTSVILPFQILIIGFCFRFGTRINKSFLKSLGYVYKSAKYQIIFAAIMAISTYVGLNFWELNGVALGVLFATVINYIQVSYRIHKILKFKFIDFLNLHFRMFIIFSPIILIILIFLLSDYYSMIFALIFSAIVILPLFIIAIRHKKSIYYNKHNLDMLKQIIENLPNGAKKIARKIKLIK